MALTPRREAIVKKLPYIETQIEPSKDGKKVIHRTIITDVKPVAFYNACLKK